LTRYARATVRMSQEIAPNLITSYISLQRVSVL
jgi:hypothetical protein